MRTEESRPRGESEAAKELQSSGLPAIVADAFGETVTLSRSEYDSLADDAACWRTLNSSPHVADRHQSGNFDRVAELFRLAEPESRQETAVMPS